MEQTAGKRRHDAKVRSARILKARNDIGISEGITSVIHEAVEHDRATPYAGVREMWGVTETAPFPYDDAALDRATETLRALSNQWQSTPDPLTFKWPTRLQAAVR